MFSWQKKEEEKKRKKKSRLNDDHWYKRRVTRGNVQIGCSCKCQMVEWIVGRMVTATFFFSRNTRKTRVMAQCGQSTFNFDAETRCLFRLVQGTLVTLWSRFIPTARLMGSLTTRTYFLRLALIDYRCTKRRIYYKSDKTLEYLTSIVPRDLTLLPLRKNNDSIGEQPVRRYPFIRHPRYIHFRGDITKRQRTRPSRQPI